MPYLAAAQPAAFVDGCGHKSLSSQYAWAARCFRRAVRRGKVWAATSELRSLLRDVGTGAATSRCVSPCPRLNAVRTHQGAHGKGADNVNSRSLCSLHGTSAHSGLYARMAQ
jgi:hypothetical protein